MADRIVLTLTEKDNNSPHVLTKCINLKFYKSCLVAYSSLYAEFAIDYVPQNDIIDAELSINDTLIHKGMICTCKIDIKHGVNFISIFSKGYTYALTKTQLKEQIVYNVLPQDIIALDPDIKNVTCITDYRLVDYVHIAEKSSVWNAICSLSNKATQNYPYIRYPNEVAMIGTGNFAFHQIPENSIVSACKCNDYSESISKITMDNVIDTEPDYNVISQYALDHNISIHKYMKYNDEWLTCPLENLQLYIDSKSAKGSFISLTHKGFDSEDLYDSLYVENLSILNTCVDINEIEIIANKKGLFTTLITYIS